MSLHLKSIFFCYFLLSVWNVLILSDRDHPVNNIILFFIWGCQGPFWLNSKPFQMMIVYINKLTGIRNTLNGGKWQLSDIRKKILTKGYFWENEKKINKTTETHKYAIYISGSAIKKSYIIVSKHFFQSDWDTSGAQWIQIVFFCNGKKYRYEKSHSYN